MLQRRCYVLRKPVFRVRSNHGALHRTLQGMQCTVADVTAVRAFHPAQPTCSCSRTALSSPALLCSLGAGRRDIRTWARKKAADVAASVESSDSPSLLDPSAAEDVKPATRGGRKRKVETAAAAAAAEPGGKDSHEVTDSSTADVGTSSSVGQPAAADEPKPVKRRTRKKKESSTAAAQHHKDTPSQQTVQPYNDLHANAPKGAHWQRVDSWVVFSDLHVGLRTINVACEVLQRVREEAAARNAGILFLGEILTNIFRNAFDALKQQSLIVPAAKVSRKGCMYQRN